MRKNSYQSFNKRLVSTCVPGTGDTRSSMWQREQNLTDIAMKELRVLGAHFDPVGCNLNNSPVGFSAKSY